mgnify:FL=1
MTRYSQSEILDTNYIPGEQRIALVVTLKNYQQVISLRKAIRYSYIFVNGEFVKSIYSNNSGNNLNPTSYMYVVGAWMTSKSIINKTQQLEYMIRYQYGMSSSRRLVQIYPDRNWYRYYTDNDVEFMFSSNNGGVFVAPKLD